LFNYSGIVVVVRIFAFLVQPAVSLVLVVVVVIVVVVVVVVAAAAASYTLFFKMCFDHKYSSELNRGQLMAMV